MYISLAYVYLIARAISAVQASYRFFHPRNFSHVETVVSCTILTARRLFNPERRIDVIYLAPASDLEDAISRACAKNGPTLIATRATQLINERIPCYIVIEHGRFTVSREMFLRGRLSLRTLQYLFLTRTSRDQVASFARDMSDSGYRDVAFIVFDDQDTGTIIRADATGDEITPRSVGSCTSLTNDVDRIPAFAADSRRFCPRGGCIMRYALVTDATVSFWRTEDTLKLKRNGTLRPAGALFIEDFGAYYNLSIDSSAGINLPWPEAFEKLMNREIDVVAGPKPADPRILNNLEVICWYMFRDMVLASLIRTKTPENDILKLLMPFHYLVWICVFLMLLVYSLLLVALGKLSSMGLMKERLRFAYVCAISLSQSVTLPRNFGLRLVLLLWILFSLYLSITYNSTFTSSLAQVDAEDLLENLEQVRDSGQPLGGPDMVRSYFNDSDDQFIKDLYDRYKVMGPEEALDSIFRNNGIAVLQHFTVDRMNWDYGSNASLRMYSLQKPVFRFPIFFFARRGYMYRRPLRQLVTKYRESGIISKVDKEMSLNEDKHIVFKQDSDEILTMKHLRPIFEIFFMCQSIGCLILLVELLTARLLRAPA
ncbi:hypothetical protein WN48_10478 [Eufriesea mexicana]|uniref:Ionotropic glutamate receptor C-terminal domain-containing protein n=1 Tax=Eufriesea mexicana TaxID=516756 RepID=A0A310S6I9_9HYME|nr:hypothetical protein WN48_10478 [Eufriesea mexicana]